MNIKVTLSCSLSKTKISSKYPIPNIYKSLKPPSLIPQRLGGKREKTCNSLKEK